MKAVQIGTSLSTAITDVFTSRAGVKRIPPDGNQQHPTRGSRLASPETPPARTRGHRDRSGNRRTGSPAPQGPRLRHACSLQPPGPTVPRKKKKRSKDTRGTNSERRVRATPSTPWLWSSGLWLESLKAECDGRGNVKHSRHENASPKCTVRRSNDY